MDKLETVHHLAYVTLNYLLNSLKLSHKLKYKYGEEYMYEEVLNQSVTITVKSIKSYISISYKYGEEHEEVIYQR